MTNTGTVAKHGTMTPTANEDRDGQTVQARVEGSATGRAVISALLVALLAALFVSNIPAESATARTFDPKVAPFLDATGLRQSWHLFGPEPRRQTTWLEAVLTYDDGTIVKWHQPRSDRYIGTYRGYRWQKWASSVLAVSSLHEPTAAWIARTNQRDGEWPVQVVLLKRQYLFPGLGSNQIPSWQETRLFVAHFPSDGPKAAS